MFSYSTSSSICAVSRTGFTRDFADTCMALLRRGVNFHNMESIILERRWESRIHLKTFLQSWQSHLVIVC